MQPNFYVISLPPGRLVATEIDSAEAAVALDAGETLLLARPLELVRVALLHNRLLTIGVRNQAGTTRIDTGHGDAADARSRDSSSPVAAGSRYQGFWREWIVSTRCHENPDRPPASRFLRQP
jgi:hypothetical protein